MTGAGDCFCQGREYSCSEYSTGVDVDFQVVGTIERIEVIASGHGIRNLSRLNRYYGKAKWRKMKGVAKVCLADGAVLDAEVHWYEGHGVGRKEIKIKRYVP